MSNKLDGIKIHEVCLTYNHADRVLRNLINDRLYNFNIGLVEWLLLGVIDQAPKSGITLSEIAVKLDVSQPQVTALMDKVASQRWVRQKVHKQDRRSRMAVLTIKGKRQLDDIESDMKQFLEVWLSEVPDDQLKSAGQLAHRIANYRPTE